MASPARWTGIRANSGRCWRTGKPGALQSVGSQRVRRGWLSGWTTATTHCPCSPSTRLPTVRWITLATISRCMSVGEFNMWNVSMITNGVDFALKRPVFLSQPQSFLTSLACLRNENNTANCPRGFCEKWSFEYRVFLRQFTSHGVLNRVIGQEVLWLWD